MISADDGISTVVLTIPMRAEFVSVARLTAMGLANRLGFDVFVIEDIQVALSEACNLIIGAAGRLPAGDCPDCRIEFTLFKDCLGIDFHIECAELQNPFIKGNTSRQPDVNDAQCGAENTQNGADSTQNGAGGAGAIGDPADGGNIPSNINVAEMQLLFVNLLMDEVVVSPKEGCLVSMKKRIE